jgi:ABC-type lipoprotein release transport system permease subunit
VDDPSKVEEVVKVLRSEVKLMNVRPWWEVNAFVSGAIKGNETLTSISVTMVFLAVLIPVLALLFIHTIQERKHIVVLAAIGFSRWAIFTIYLLKSVFVGMLGSLLGAVIGIGVCTWFEANPIFAYNGFLIRPAMTISGIAIPIALVFGVTVLGGILPAFHAARANPSVELRTS